MTTLPQYRCHKEVSAVKIAEVRRDRMPLFKGFTCRGTLYMNQPASSLALQSGCGNCERCDWLASHGPALGASIVAVDPGLSPIHVDGAYLLKHDPRPGGYFVEYADGYRSFSPAEAFEAGYTRI